MILFKNYLRTLLKNVNFKYFLICIIILNSLSMVGQTFNGDNEGALIDQHTDVAIVESSTNVTLTGTIGLDYIIDNVTLNIAHEHNVDLELKVFAPDGTSITLCTSEGGDSRNFTNTVFKDGGASIRDDTGPFTGIYRPFLGSFSSTFAGKSVTGNWKLRIHDQHIGFGLDDGVFGDYSITFTTTCEAPTANALQIYAGTATLDDLSVASTGNLLWYAVANGGTAIPATTSLVNGSTYYVSQLVGCGETTRTAITVNKVSEDSQNLCYPATVADLVSTPSAGQTANWYADAGGGSALTTVTALESRNLYVSQTTEAGESARVLVHISVNKTPAPFADSTQLYTGDANLSDLSVTGTNLLWYNAATGGNTIATSTDLVSGTIYYVSQTGICGESLRTSIIANKISEATQNLCISATVEDLISTPTTDQTASWFTDATGGEPLLSSAEITTGTYYVEQTMANRVTTLADALNSPMGVAVQADGKILFVDNTAGIIKIMDNDGLNVQTFATGFTNPRGILIQPNGKILVVDNARIKRVDADGTNIQTLGHFSILSIVGIAVQSDGKIVFVDFHDVKRMDADGSNIEILGSGFHYPSGLTVQPNGKIIVVDQGNNLIKRMESNGSNIQVLGNTTLQGYENAILVQSDGSIIFGNSNKVMRMNSDGSNTQSIAGGFAIAGGIAIESDRKILVADTGNNAIKRITIATLNITNRVAINVVVETTEVPTTSTVVTYNQNETASPLTATVGANGSGLLWYESATGGVGSINAPTPNTDVLGSKSYWVSSTTQYDCESERVEIVVYTNGSVATHLNFDGIDDYIELSEESNFDFTNAMTVEFWMKSGAIPQQWDALVAKGDDSWRVALTSDGKIIFSGTGAFNDLQSNTTVTDDNWHHVAVTYDGSAASIYIDGILDNSDVATGNINNSSYKVSISENLQARGRYFEGNIDELRVWNVARSAIQINTTKDSELPDDETGIVAYHRFNHGFDASINSEIIAAADATFNNLTGTLFNFSLTGATSNWLAGSPISSNTIVPDAPVASAQSLCEGSTVADLIAVGSNLRWYKNETEILNLNTSVELTSATYYVSQTADWNQSTRTAVDINLIKVFAPTAKSTQIYAGTATLADLEITGSNLTWYDQVTNGSIISETTTLVNGEMYYVSQTTSCGESLRTTITVNQISESTQVLCDLPTVADLLSTPSAGQIPHWYATATGGDALDSSTGILNGTYYVEETIPVIVEDLLGMASSFVNNVVVLPNSDLLVTILGDVIHMKADGSSQVVLGSGFGQVKGLVVQEDGKIIVVDYNNWDVKRMNPDGTGIVLLRDGFIQPNTVAVQSSGKILISDYTFGLSRMDADGSNHEVLRPHAYGNYVTGLAVQSDDTIIISIGDVGTIERYHADGTFDQILANGLENPTQIAIQPDGKIMVATQGNSEIIRMDADGSNIETIATGVANVTSIALDANEKIMVSQTFFTGALGFHGFLKRISQGSTTNRISIDAVVTATCPINWTGAENTDWNNVNNWNPMTIPGSADVAVIKTASNQPVVGSSTAVDVLSLISDSAASLTVQGVLKVTDKIYNDGKLIFESNSSTTGQLDEFVGTLSGTGSVEVQRYIPAKRAYRFLSTSVTTPGSIYDNWQEGGSSPTGFGTHITGSETGANGFDISLSGNQSFFTFDNNLNSWQGVPNTDVENLEAGTAYRLYVRGDRNIELTSENRLTNATVLRSSGAIKTGSYSPSLSTTANGFSFVGNPYQAVVDFNLVTKSDLSDFMYVWDASIANEGVYVSVDLSDLTAPAAGSSDANQFIAPGQAFFVRNTAAGNGSITFEENDKSTSASQVTVFSTFADFYINSQLYKTADLLTGGMESDALGLRFRESYTTAGSDEDAVKFANPGENYAIANNGLRSIDKQSLPTAGHEIQLSLDNYTTTDYSLSFDMDNRPSDIIVFLYDAYLNTQTELAAGSIYDFTVDTSIANSIATDRFKLVFQQETLGLNTDIAQNIRLYPNPAYEVLQVDVPAAATLKSVGFYNMLGQQIMMSENKIIDITGLKTGVYLVKVTTAQGQVTQKIIKK